MRKIHKGIYNLIAGLSYLYILALVLLSGISYWPRSMWWISSVVTLIPVWVHFIPVFVILMLLIVSRQLKTSIVLLSIFSLAIFQNIDVSSGMFTPEKKSNQEMPTLGLITANMGYGSNLERLVTLVDELDIDLVALQESGNKDKKKLQDTENWETVCSGHMCVMSRHPAKLINAKSRRVLGNWGTFVMQVEVQLPVVGSVDIFNVHLQTPRHGLDEIIYQPIRGIPAMKINTEERHIESLIASTIARAGRKTIVMGDFNMTVINPIYHNYWSWLNNSFNSAGKGFGYTKYTRWLGARIDHVLYDDNWTAIEARTLHALGGDHLPVYVKIRAVNMDDLR